MPGVAAAVAPAAGSKLFLTIDKAIQQIATKELQRMVNDYRARGGYVIMADPKTGAIRALAEVSAHADPRNKTDPANERSRLLADVFEPGSILKPIVAMTALDCGVASPDTAFDCGQGMWVYAGRALRDPHPYGKLTLHDIVAKSSNIGTARIAVAIGQQRLYESLLRLGFGAPTGMGLPGEPSGLVPALAQWDDLAFTRIAIGQGIQVTALQLVQAYCAIANRGMMPQLRLVDHTEDTATGRSEANPPRLKGRVVSEKAAQDITEALKSVTQDGGTAPKAAVSGRQVAGVTCSAQKMVNGGYSMGKFVAGFVGFVPADAPAFVLLVMADEPGAVAYYGGTVAAPTFSRIAGKTLEYLAVSPVKSDAR